MTGKSLMIFKLRFAMLADIVLFSIVYDFDMRFELVWPNENLVAHRASRSCVVMDFQMIVQLIPSSVGL